MLIYSIPTIGRKGRDRLQWGSLIFYLETPTMAGRKSRPFKL